MKTSWQAYGNINWAFVILLLTVMGFDLFLNRIFNYKYAAEQRAEVTVALSNLTARLVESINSNLFIVYGMGAYIANSHDVTQDEFIGMSKTLLRQSTTLLNIAIAPGFVIKWVYPYSGNEKIIGLDYRKLPDQWEQARKTQTTGSMVIAGPIKLIQGGMGLVARAPVFLEKDHSFWGIVSSVMDLDKLLAYAEVNKSGNALKIAIRGKDGLGAEGEIFEGEGGIFSQSEKPVKQEIKLPLGSWEIAAVPKAGWRVSNPYHLKIHLLSFLLFLIAVSALLNRSRHKQALVERNERLQSMAAASHDALIMINSESVVMLWNHAAENMFGYTSEEAIGMDMHKLICREEDRDYARAGMKRFADAGTGPVLGCIMEMVGVRRSGETFPVERSVASFKHRGKWYAIGSLRDITARKNNEEKLIELSRTDFLTGLANRRYLLEQAQLILAQACRYARPCSVMMFDLDHFKDINDTYGHDAGDKVLQMVAMVVKRTLRQTDVVGRIGGEEFMAILPETGNSFAESAAERFRIALADEVLNIGLEIAVKVTVSIGLTHRMSNDATIESLMKLADEALYKAKNQGRNRVCVI